MGAHLLSADQSASGKVADITDATKSWIADVGTAANKLDHAVGKQMGLPYTMHVVGFSDPQGLSPAGRICWRRL